MISRRPRAIVAASVGAALAFTAFAGAGVAQAADASGAAAILQAVNTARESAGAVDLRSNGYLTGYAQEVSAVYAAKGPVEARAAKTADTPPPGCSRTILEMATATGSTALAELETRFASIDTSSSNYGAVGFTVDGSAAHAVFAGISCASRPLDKISGGTISLAGTPQVGKPFIARVSGFVKSDATSPSDLPTLQFEWFTQNPGGGGHPVGDNSASYIPQPADVGSRLAVAVVATAPGYNPLASDSVSSSAAVKLGVLPSPSTQAVTGSRNVGMTLTASTSAWSVGKLGFQWLRGGKAIAGATAATYAQVAADHGHTITVKVSDTSPGYVSASKTSKTSTKTGYPFLRLVDPVGITGTRQLGKVVSANVGAWAPVATAITYTYQWYEGGKLVAHATHATHTIGAVAAATNSISLAVTAHESHFAPTTVMSPVGTVGK
jgi:hypothetical protein